MPAAGAIRSRTESRIAVARAVLGASSLFAIWLDPAEPSTYAGLTYSLHALYVAYAVSLAAFTLRGPVVGWLPLATHGFDIVAFSVFQYLTLGPSSPFFLYFVFSLFCAALRWNWQGVLWTALLVLPAYMGMGAWISWTLPDNAFELNRFIIRTVYLGVAAALLVYLGLHEAQLRDEIRRLARWPQPSGAPAAELRARVLEHAGAVMGARQVLVVWDVDDEPWRHLALWDATGTATERLAPGALEPLVASEHAAAVLVTTGAARAGEPSPVHPDVASRLTGTVVSAPFAGDQVSGRLFLAGLDGAAEEILPLAEVVARETGATLDALEAADRSGQLAIREERVRVARDLHDGVLQSLTALRLELRALADGGAVTEGRTLDRLLAVERALALEQRELRIFIDGLRPAGVSAAVPTPRTVGAVLASVRDRVAGQWRVPVEVEADAPDQLLEAATARALALMVHEAVVNALKHGGPSRVQVAARHDGRHLSVRVSDDGCGFAFHGRHDHAALVRSGQGPASLRDRIGGLGGQLAVDSGPAGATVELILPVGNPGA
ncbi:MAG: sensor histidine kinase [Vicinamibacterales bacterium]